MAVRDKLRASAAPHLRPGEQIQAVFLAQRANPAWFLLSYWIILFKGYYAVIVTDQRLLVFRTSAMAMTKYKQLEKELPRQTVLGPPSGTVNAKVRLGDEDTWVHRRFWNDLKAADAAIGR
jgi:hypothetical protein